MGTMFKVLKEDNEQISEMVKQLDKKILEVKANNKIPHEYLEALVEFYQEAILPWMEQYYLVDKEIEPENEQAVQDKIYNIFLLIQALEE